MVNPAAAREAVLIKSRRVEEVAFIKVLVKVFGPQISVFVRKTLHPGSSC
jgi:hypothetical protein